VIIKILYRGFIYIPFVNSVGLRRRFRLSIRKLLKLGLPRFVFAERKIEKKNMEHGWTKKSCRKKSIQTSTEQKIQNSIKPKSP